MRRLVLGAVLTVLATTGCGGSDVKSNTAPMTDEEVRKMKEEDRQIDDQERSGSGSATPARRK
jgi:hypothetical protein